MKSVIVSVHDLARPGVSLSAAYWLPPEEGGHRDGESAPAWRKRLRKESSVRHVQERVAQLGGIFGHGHACDTCLGSGLVWAEGMFTLCVAKPVPDATVTGHVCPDPAYGPCPRPECGTHGR